MLKWTVSTTAKRPDVADNAYFFEAPTTTTTTRPTNNGSTHAPNAHRHSELIGTPQPLNMRQLIATSTPYGSNETIASAVSPPEAIPKRKRKSNSVRNPASAYACTLPTFGVEYSPMVQPSGPAIALRGITIPDSFFGNARYFPAASANPAPTNTTTETVPPALKRRRLCLAEDPVVQAQRRAAYLDEEADLNRSSKALDDQALQQMIDEILQSNRKPTQSSAKRRQPHQRCRQTAATIDEDFVFVSHKPIMPEQPANGERSPIAAAATEIRPDKSEHITKLIDEHPFLRQSIELLAGMQTPTEPPTAAVDGQDPVPRRSATNSERSPGEQRSAGTPVGPEQIRRCLTFPESPESLERWLVKRQSVASTGSTISRCSAKSGAAVTGSLNLAIRTNALQTEVHVIRCKDLQRNNGGPINAYVKVARVAAADGGHQPQQQGAFQRTRVHRDSADPFFNHRFIFERPPSTDCCSSGSRIQLTVWHRDRETKRSEFLGCLAFPADDAERSVFGAFALQPLNVLSQCAENRAAGTENCGLQLTEQLLRTRDLQMAQQEHLADRAELETKLAAAEGQQQQTKDIDGMMGYADRQTRTSAYRNVEATFKHSLCVG